MKALEDSLGSILGQANRPQAGSLRLHETYACREQAGISVGVAVLCLSSRDSNP